MIETFGAAVALALALQPAQPSDEYELYLPCTSTGTEPPPRPFVDLCDAGSSQNDNCANACLLGLTPPNAPYLGTISRGTDQDWFETVGLPAGDYRLSLQPAEGLDYDLQLYEPGDPSRRTCPGPLFGQSGLAGDALEEIRFTIPASAAGYTAYVRVYPGFRSEWDLYAPYELGLFPESAPQPTATLTATPAAARGAPGRAVSRTVGMPVRQPSATRR